MALAVLGAAGAWLYGQSQGLAGYGLGVAGGAFGVGALWLTIRLMAASASAARPPAAGVAIAMMMVAGKIPLLLYLAGASRGIGDAAFDCFLGGVMLVYFAAVGGAATGGSEDETPASDGPSTG